MALMYARYPDPEPVSKAVKLVMSRQRPVWCFATTRLRSSADWCLKL